MVLSAGFVCRTGLNSRRGCNVTPRYGVLTVEKN